MPRIFIMSGITRRGRCVVCDSEMSHIKSYVNLICKYFSRSSIDFYVDNNSRIQDAVAECNAIKPDLCYIPNTMDSVMHDRKFSSLYVNSMDSSSIAYRMADQIRNCREEFYNGAVFINEFKNTDSFSKVQAPIIADCLVFHDNVEQAKFFHDNMEVFAISFVKAICEYFNVLLKESFSICRQENDDIAELVDALKKIREIADQCIKKIDIE
ncbi:MAG: hypothetical protein Q4B04_00690 [bacterium]|nr:hypothetical protein [bacterium]